MAIQIATLVDCLNGGFSCSVSEDLLCAFELLKPLDGPALRKEMTKAKRKRQVFRELGLSTLTDQAPHHSMMNAA